MALKQAEREFRAQMALYGMRWCPGCAAFLTIGMFGTHKRRADGLTSRCLGCEVTRVARRRADSAYREREATQQSEYRAANPGRNAQWKAANPDKVSANHAKRRAAQAGVPSVPFDRTAYYGLPCWSCGAESTVHDHFFALQGARTPLTVDAPCNVLPQCGTCSSRKSNKDPVEWWARDHRPFDRVTVVADETEWLNSEPDWAHVAAGL